MMAALPAEQRKPSEVIGLVLGLFLPMDAFNRASFNGLVDTFFIAAFLLDDDGHLIRIIEFENLRAHFHTSFAARAFFRIDDNAFGHGGLLSRRVGWFKYPRFPLPNALYQIQGQARKSKKSVPVDHAPERSPALGCKTDEVIIRSSTFHAGDRRI
jgi:hypothetical protein